VFVIGQFGRTEAERGTTLHTLRKKVLAAAAVIVAALVATPAVASAAPASFTENCFGYVGTFLSGSKVAKADYNKDNNPDECFGIAPNRHIYHAWPHHSWVEMPYDGRADNTVFAGWATDPHGFVYHTIVVHVNGVGDYCAVLGPPWAPWQPCTFQPA
jgi:hypothetical protein